MIKVTRPVFVVSLVWVGVAAIISTFPAQPALAQEMAQNDEQYNCLIEPRTVAKIGSSGEGVIQTITVDRGDEVKRGDVLAVLESSMEVAEVELARLRANNDVAVESSKARLVFEQERLERTEQLFTKGVVPTSVLEEVKTARMLATIDVRSSQIDMKLAHLSLGQAQVALDRRTIHSPVDGIVAERSMAPGEYAYDQSPLMTIAEMDPLNIEVYVPIERYRSITIGMGAKVLPDEPVGGTYDATVAVVDKVFDAASGTFGVRLELANPDYTLPAGLKCHVRFNGAG